MTPQNIKTAFAPLAIYKISRENPIFFITRCFMGYFYHYQIAHTVSFEGRLKILNMADRLILSSVMK